MTVNIIETQSNFEEIIQKNSIKLEKILLNSIEDKKIFSTIHSFNNAKVLVIRKSKC